MNPAKATDLQEAAARGDYLRVMDAIWRRHERTLSSSRQLIDKGLYDEEWSVTVYPVPREFKRVVRESLDRLGLPQMRTWLQSFVPLAHLRGRRGTVICVRVIDGDVRTNEIA